MSTALATADDEQIEIVLDLPAPPSVNRLWRSGRKRVFRSKAFAGG
jgi:hypothetical protein